MSVRFQVFGFLLVTSLGGAAILAQPTSEHGPSSEYGSDRSPEEVYAQTCGYCHGRNVGPIIRGRNLHPDLVKYFVRNGFNAMPAFRPTEINDTELEHLAQWINASQADPSEVGK